ncbi:MAG: hypothetical protein CMO40_08175 [Verrucomicrobiaceae bacterium]|nr:hypothetical protein [Verrucomicrobiaceae bacterium]
MSRVAHILLTRFDVRLLIIPGVLVVGNLAQGGFIHPGLLHTRADLVRMQKEVASGKGPVFEAFRSLEKSPYAAASYAPKGPFPEWGRAPDIRKGEAESDALATYQNALMWTITGKRDHALKAISILNSWTNTLKKVGGIDGVLAAGLQGFMFVNAAELLRHTDSGWTEAEAARCGKWLQEVWDRTIEHYAYFANGNWETAALQTRLAIAVYCDDRDMFEEVIRYAVAGAGNGSIPHMIIDSTGQCQETTRAQHYAQLGLGLLACAAEVAWNQGVDLYGWGDNRILRGFEYTAKYGLGEDVPFRHYLDRTGKYGFGGRHNNYTQISPLSRGSFFQIFERVYNHYENRRRIATPSLKRVVRMKEPEGFSSDNIGLGTLTHRRKPAGSPAVVGAPGSPAGCVARSLQDGIRLRWVTSVDPVGVSNAQSYEVMRSSVSGGRFRQAASGLTTPEFFDRKVDPGKLYFYRITASNSAGTSSPSMEISASAGLPASWRVADVGDVSIPGFAEYDGKAFTLEGEGHDIGGRSDEFLYVHTAMAGDGGITARIRRPMSSQWTKPGVMMRQSLDSDSPHVSVLLQPHWSGSMVSRSGKGGRSVTAKLVPLGEEHVIKKNRLSSPYWVRLERVGDLFKGSMSADGKAWEKLGSVKVKMGEVVQIGLPACSQLHDVTTTVTYDRVSVPSWSMPGS